MSFLKRKLSLLLSNDLQKVIMSLLDEDENSFLDQEAYSKFHEMMQNKNPKFTRIEAFDNLLKHCLKTPCWPVALRALMTIHKLIHESGESFFCMFFSSKKVTFFSQYKPALQPLKTFIHSAMIPHYSNYLQKLSYNFDDLKVCFVSDNELIENLHKNNLTMFHFITKVQNVLGYLLKMAPLFESSFVHCEDLKLIKQLAYFCMTDCYYYYTFVNGILQQTLGEIFYLAKEDAVFLYEIYCENIQLTRKLVDFFEIRNHLSEFKLLIPDFYNIDLEFNKRLELYIAGIKNEIGSPKKLNKLKQRYQLEIVTETEATIGDLDGKPEKNVKSIDDLSKILLQVTTPSFKTFEKKEFFLPPAEVPIDNKCLQFSSGGKGDDEEEEKSYPQIHVHKPNNNVQYLTVPTQTVVVAKKDAVTFRGEGTPDKNANYKMVLQHTPEGSRDVSFVENYNPNN